MIVVTILPAVVVAVLEDFEEIADGDALLGHGVAVADGYGVVVEGVEVDGDAVGGADLVLAAIAAADALGVVELGAEAAADQVIDAAGGRSETGRCG